MATVTVFTSTRMLAIESQAIVGGTVNGSGQLILTRNNGATITAGSVIGPTGATGPSVADLGITTAKIAALAVTTAKIADSAVTNDKLAGSIPASKLLGVYSKSGSTSLQQITITNTAPTSGTGIDGDIWLRY